MTDTGHQTWFDKLLAWILGASIVILAWCSGNSVEFPPELWDKISIAAKLRPSANEFPLLWPIFTSFSIDYFGIDSTIKWLKLLGPVSLGVLSVISYRLFAGYLPPLMKGDMNYSKWGRWIVRLVLVQGVIIFVCSEPIWLAGRIFSPEMFMLLLTVTVLFLSLYTVERASSISLIIACALCGVMASENILAFFIPFILRYYLAFKYRTMTDIAPPLASPIVFAVAMRRAAFAFVLSYVGSAALILYFYTANGGGGEEGQNIFNIIVKYFLNYFDILKNAMTPMGWFLLLAVVIFPLVVVTFKLRQLTDIQKLLPISYACFLIFVGIIAFSQSTGFSYLHFWKWEIGAVHDEYLLCMAILGSSILTMMILAIFSVDVFYRNYSRIFREIFDYDNEDKEVTYNILRSLKISLKYLRLPLQFVPIVVLALIIPYKFDSTIREMSSIVNKIAHQAADECGNAKMVFTDGSYDGAIEVAAFRKGKNLKAISMMSGSGKYDVALRLRGEVNQENIDLLKIGAADALRTWVHGKFDCASNIAIQVGFELWQFNKLPVPQAAGLVARTARFEDDKLKDYVSSAKEISENILSLYKKCDLVSIAYPELNKLFVFGQWRLARMCRMRANEADRAKNWKLSEEESALADRLDKANPEWNKVEEKTRWISLQGNSQLTPREGLKLGLTRADFRMASSYARRILDTDPDDMNANFALGMKYFTEKLYEKSEFHLKKCLVRAPDEPAVLNNLAVVQLRLGKLDEAETNAVRALNRFPSSHEIKATLRHVKDARKEIKK